MALPKLENNCPDQFPFNSIKKLNQPTDNFKNKVLFRAYELGSLCHLDATVCTADALFDLESREQLFSSEETES